MILTNAKKLAKTPARSDALAIIEAGYENIAIDQIVNQSLKLEGQILTVQGQRFNLSRYRRILVAGVGKGSALVAKNLEKLLGNRLNRGFVIDIAKVRMKRIKAMAGTHPLPSEANIKATERIIELLESAQQDDLVITIICGGGSALFCKPGSLTCLELQFLSNHLLKAGATIQQINTVRKHVSLIHGGGLAKYAYPATVLSLIISDVPGDDLGIVSSGPTVPDTTTKRDAERVAHRFGLPPIEMMETPKDGRYFKKVHNILIGNGSLTVEAMAKKAQQLGYKPRIVSRKLQGFAKEVGPTLAKLVRPGEVLLACGETEVIVTKPGRGGRNQDVVVSAMPYLTGHDVIVAAASDGKDNVKVAGGIADGHWSLQQLKRKRLNPTEAVIDNQSFKILAKLKDHLQIHKVTANVSDFMLVLGAKSENR